VRLMDFEIWSCFLKPDVFELTAKQFNELPRDEKVKIFNSIGFYVKEMLTEDNPSGSKEMKKVFTLIDKRLYEILFG